MPYPFAASWARAERLDITMHLTRIGLRTTPIEEVGLCSKKSWTSCCFWTVLSLCLIIFVGCIPPFWWGSDAYRGCSGSLPAWARVLVLGVRCDMWCLGKRVAHQHSSDDLVVSDDPYSPWCLTLTRSSVLGWRIFIFGLRHHFVGHRGTLLFIGLTIRSIGKILLWLFVTSCG